VPDILLKNVSVEKLTRMGDAALLAGDLLLARGLYRNALAAEPASVALQARVGLTQQKKRAAPMVRALAVLEEMSPNVFIGDGLATWFKLPAFTHDPRFMATVEKHHALSPGPNWHWNLQTVLWAAQQARAVPGDFVELGVFRGHTTLFVADYLEFAGWPKRWWLFDTFDGVPDDQLDPGWAEANKAVYRDTFSFEEVRDRFAPFGNILVTKGRVPEVLETTCPEAISFMHVDLNNATAEVAALDKLYDRLSPGGIIVFDDFQWTNSRAQFAAETAWFAARGLGVLPLPTGQGVFVKPLAA
jgi:O-methyltransferase